ncbi:hypothetical protein [Dyadobacter frigoris]|uniref:Uncharacterized protein n=1 Tax=Dyadobacter frigoris TaxID=2576211 RepID=A0A4U6D7H0_9BACT|nr:hypothetical protein [Dyadobacter frigoris]TKT92221.1 hypothetical protein FDK13_09545 [Dyadobacter frigoris]GLU53396.1 hypothetical protein Dfri01_28570 [Dyadobacter frigoris]
MKKINVLAIIVCLILSTGLYSCDKQEENVSKRSINRASDLILGGWDSDYGSCYDVDKAYVYGSGQMADPDILPMIDLFFDHGQLWNIDGAGLNRLPDTGIRFAKTEITADQFDILTDDKSFANLEPTLEVIPILPGDVVFFKSKNGKKGLLKIKSMNSPTGEAYVDEIIQNI